MVLWRDSTKHIDDFGIEDMDEYSFSRVIILSVLFYDLNHGIENFVSFKVPYILYVLYSNM